MSFKKIFPLVFAFMTLGPMLLPLAARCETSGSAADLYRSGVASFQKADDNAARASLRESLKLDANNPWTLYNLGLTEFRAGNKGLALALWRKALFFRPGLSAAQQAVSFARNKLERAEIAHESEVWETLRSAALVSVPISSYFALLALMFFAAGWLLLRYFGLRRTSRLDDKPTPPFPFVATVISVLFCLSLLLTIAKIYDNTIIRGTILEKKVEARSSPDASATPLFELYEGLEVIVDDRRDDWVQVTYPGGSTGWIKASSIFAINQDVEGITK